MSSPRGSPPAEYARGEDFYPVLLAMVGHDLRNQLQAIISAHRGLERHFPEGPEKLYLDLGKAAAARLTHQLEELLDALRLYQDKDRLPLAPVALAPILSALDREMIEPAWRKNVSFEVALVREHIVSNANLLSSILRNLAHNAIKFTPSGGRVTVGCRKRDESVCIEISDTGIGIAPDQAERIFEAFYRADSESDDGLGLGLFIARRAANLLRHNIEVQSKPGAGSCFSIVAQRHPESAAGA
jgi:two-component system phosphate regulon sensor histidine kinase PhoR